jgi:cyclomaltodextrinase
MGWPDHAIFWHTYPLGLGGAPIRAAHTPGHRLRAVIDRLDHVLALGANGLLLGPVFASVSHGYDTTDHFRIDPRLGDGQDFDDLVVACRARGIRLVLDGVFNHVAVGHPALPALQAVDSSGRPEVFEGHGALLRLDHRRPETADLVVEVMNHWCDRGVDGWRLDAAYSVDTAFWATVLPIVRERHPDLWVVGEVLHGDYSTFVHESGVDSVTQYQLWKAIWSSLADRNLFELDWALQRHNEFLDTFVPQTFVGNHDVTRITSAVGQRGAVAALAILLTVGGVPSIYYGDELGLTGIKEQRIGGDDAVRPVWPSARDTADDAVFRAHRDLIGLRRRHPWLVHARTQLLDLTNTSAVLRSTAADSTDHLDLDLDLHGQARVTVRDSAGRTLWSTPA